MKKFKSFLVHNFFASVSSKIDVRFLPLVIVCLFVWLWILVYTGMAYGTEVQIYCCLSYVIGISIMYLLRKPDKKEDKNKNG